MKRTVSLYVLLPAAVSLMILTGPARAGYTQVFEKDINADLSFLTYDTLTDVATGWSARTGNYQSIGVWNNEWSMVGLAYDGTQYIQAFEKDINADLSFLTYDTLADVVTGWSARTGHYQSIGIWNNEWSMVGLAYDGTQYIQVFEKDINADLSFLTYDTLADVVTGWSASTGNYQTIGVWNNDWSMVGFDYDGTQYIQAFERDINADLSFLTYDTLADVVTGWSASTGNYQSIGVWNNEWSMVGLAYEGPAAVPAPSALVLGLIGLGALRVTRRERR